MSKKKTTEPEKLDGRSEKILEQVEKEFSVETDKN